MFPIVHAEQEILIYERADDPKNKILPSCVKVMENIEKCLFNKNGDRSHKLHTYIDICVFSFVVE